LGGHTDIFFWRQTCSLFSWIPPTPSPPSPLHRFFFPFAAPINFSEPHPSPSFPHEWLPSGPLPRSLSGGTVCDFLQTVIPSHPRPFPLPLNAPSRFRPCPSSQPSSPLHFFRTSPKITSSNFPRSNFAPHFPTPTDKSPCLAPFSFPARHGNFGPPLLFLSSNHHVFPLFPFLRSLFFPSYSPPRESPFAPLSKFFFSFPSLFSQLYFFLAPPVPLFFLITNITKVLFLSTFMFL